jgi:gliding motility-associated-like protein
LLNYSCGGSTDTIRQVVNVNQPCISVQSTSITCASLGSATVAATGGIGPFSYTWMPGNQTSSVATGLSPGIYTIAVYDAGVNFSYTATTIFTSLVPLTGSLSNTGTLSCNGAHNGTATINNLSGGSGNQTYSWYNGSQTFTTAIADSLSSGIWSVTVTDVLTGCQINQNFYIAQPPPLNLSLSANPGVNCVGSNVVLTATNSGGTAPYTYTWTNGPAQSSHTVSEPGSGTYVYTLTSRDSHSCVISNTISVGFIDNPVVTVSNVTVCPQKSGTLVASGATSYTWNNTTPGSTYIDNPGIATAYTVVGTAAGCTGSAVATIYLFATPVATISSNSPVCNGQPLQLYTTAGSSYIWSGPALFSSVQQNPIINAATLNQGGVYGVTVTAATGCTVSATHTVVMQASPLISASGSTVCSTQTIQLTGNGSAGVSYLWSGPLGYTSSAQNPSLYPVSVNHSGTYTVKVTSATGCTNAAVTQVTVTQLPVPNISSDGPKCSGASINFQGTGTGNYSWSGPNLFSSTLQNPSISAATPLASGVYTLTISLGPCVADTTHSLVVYSLPTVTASWQPTVCEQHDLKLSATSPGTIISYSWLGPGWASNQQSPQRSNSALSFAGVYTVTVTDQNNCMSSATTTVVIESKPKVSASSITVCTNASATISAGGASTYTWSGPNAYQSQLADAVLPSVSASITGIYTVTGTAANSCTASATASLSIIPLPLPVMTVLPKTKLCLNDEITFKGAGGFLYRWFGPDNIYYEGQNISFTLTSLSHAGIYSLEVIDQRGCRASTSTVISIDPLPQGSLMAGRMDGCAPFCSGFYFVPAGKKVSAAWSTNGIGLGASNFTACFNTVGEHLLKGKLYDSLTTCRAELTFTVNAHERPKADFRFSPEKPVENNDYVIFTNTSQGDRITENQWFFIDNKGYTTTAQNSSYHFTEPGDYPVALIVKNEWGCADSTLKLITVAEDFAIYVPNVFTPNGDEDNEVFMAQGRGIKLFNLTIYDRWGQRVFIAKDINSGWDGSFMNQPCKSDVYTWKIEASSIHGQAKILTGHVTLYR